MGAKKSREQKKGIQGMTRGGIPAGRFSSRFLRPAGILNWRAYGKRNNSITGCLDRTFGGRRDYRLISFSRGERARGFEKGRRDLFRGWLARFPAFVEMSSQCETSWPAHL